MTASSDFAAPLSLVSGVPLAEELCLGALTLPGYLREVTTRFATREALVLHLAEGVSERWTYADLWQRSIDIARALTGCGVGRDARVGVLMTNRPEWIAAVFGIGLAGAVAVTLSTFSTPAELAYLVRASGVGVLLFERAVLKKDFSSILRDLEPSIDTSFPGNLHSDRFPYLRRLVALGEEPVKGAMETWNSFLGHGQAISSTLVEAMAAEVKPADAGVLFFSSGTTGTPKGILCAHRAVAIQCWRWRRILALNDKVRSLTVNGFFWSGNFGMAIGGTFSSGGTLILQRTFDPVETLELLEREQVTYPIAWPHQIAQLADAPNWGEVNLSSLRYVDARTAFGRHPTVVSTWHEPRAVFGSTETFTLNTAFAADTAPERVNGTHGVPLPGNTIKIVDPITGAVTPRGVTGEIAVKGPTLMLGYLGIPLEHTFDAEGFFHTGDGGHLDHEGRLVWAGRLSDIIKTGGANVSPVEVDIEIARYPGVKVSQTVGLPHRDLGEVVVACVVPVDGCHLDANVLRDYLKTRLASYKVPRRVIFLADGELCLTGSAKIKTSALREYVEKRLKSEAADSPRPV